MTHFRPQPPQEVARPLKQAGLILLLFLCVFIPFRQPLADLTFSGVKAVPDVLILCLAAWYVVSVRFRLRFQWNDLLFLAFEGTALVSCLVNHIPVALWVYETRSIGIYYILYFVIRNFGYGRRELILFTKTLQGVSLPLLALVLVEKITSKTVLFSPLVLATIGNTNLGRAYSMFYNPNTYGLFLTFTILLSLWLALRTDYKTPVWIYAVLATSLYMTQSRSSILILAAGLAVLLVCAVREKKLNVRRLALSGAVIAAAAVVVLLGSTWGAKQYFTRVAQYQLVDRVKEGYSEAQYIVEVPYITPDGVEHTGYVYHDITYIDKECTTTLNEYGSIVYTRSTAYILTKNGGMKLEEYQALPAAEQADLVAGSGARLDENRTNEIIDAMRGSLDSKTGDRFDDLKDSAMYTADFNGRLYSLQYALKVIHDYPILGTGFGTFGSAASTTWKPPTYGVYVLRENFYADNQYACVLAETGILGFVLFLAFLLCTLWTYRKDLLKGMACVMIGWFGLFYNILEVQIGAFLLWSVLSFVLTAPAAEDDGGAAHD